MAESVAHAEPRFVGASRHALVDGLLAVHDEVRTTARPRWVSLEAPSGWGKTRTAREFYARLAQRQPDPAYWPPTILGDAPPSTLDISARRKKVNPDVEHQPGSLPSYLWWGISCSSRNGVASVALAQDIAIFEAHAPYLDDAWLRLPGTSRLGQDLRSFARASIDEGAMELAGTGVQAVLGTAVPGLGLVRWVGEWAWGKHRDARARGDRLTSTGAIEASRDDIADELVAILSRLARPGLPAVIFIEDLHDADTLLVDVITRLLSTSSAILIISTGWPGHLDELEVLREAMTEVGDRLLRVTSEAGGAPLPEPFPAGASLAPLGTEDLATLLHHYYPRVEQSTERLVVARYPNPLALELFCQIDRVRRRFTDRVLVLSASDIDHLPASIGGLYRQHWNELPDSVRHALAVATLGIPAVLDPSLGRSPLWNHDLMVQALQALDLPGSQDVARSLGSASTAYAWARVVSDTLRRFSEPDQLQVALEDQRSYLFEDEMSTVKNALATRLADTLDGLTEADEREHAARLLVALEAEGFVDDPLVLGRASVALLDLLRDDPRELLERIRIAEHALRVVDPVSQDGITLRRELGNAQGTLGRTTESRTTLAGLIEDLTRLHGPSAQVTLEARMEYLASAADGALGDELDQARALAQEAAHALGPEHRVALRSGNLMAIGLSDQRRRAEAIAEYERLHALALASLGPQDRMTLVLASNLSVELDLDGRVEEALALSQETLRARSAALGPVHPDTILNRRNLIAFQVDAGRFTEAVSGYGELLADADAGLGPLHPETLHIMSRYAGTLQDLGRAEESLVLQRELVQRRERTTGTDSAQALSARVDLARILAWAASLSAAQETYQQVIEDAQRVLGPTAELTLTARQGEAILQRSIHGHAEAARLLFDLFTDASAALGEEHSITLGVGQELCTSLIELDKRDDAISILEALIELRRSQPVLDEWALAQHIASLAYAHRREGDPQRALDLLNDHLPRVVARFGASSGTGIQYRNDIAMALRAAGRGEEAAETLQQIILDTADARAAADAQILYVRTTLAEVLSDADQHQEAALVLREAYRVAVDSLGLEHQTTLHTGIRLMWALQRVDASVEALTLGVPLVGRVREVHGPTSPAYRDVLWPLANSALAGEGDYAQIWPFLDEFVALLDADPDVSDGDRAWARVRRGFAALFNSDSSCLEDFRTALSVLQAQDDPDSGDAQACRELLRIATDVFSDDSDDT